MEQFMFTLFSSLSGFSIGAALFAVYARVRLFMLATTSKARKRHTYSACALTGYALTAGTVLAAIIPRAAVQPRPLAWLYVVGLMLAGIGYAGQAREATDELAVTEMKQEEGLT